ALRLGPQLQRCESEQAGARSDVGNIREPPAFTLQSIERCEATAGCRMLASAEGEAGVDLEIDAVRFGSVGWCVNGEAARADRLQPRLAHRHPIVLSQLLEARRPVAEVGQGRNLMPGRFMLEIGVKKPLVGLGLVGL